MASLSERITSIEASLARIEADLAKPTSVDLSPVLAATAQLKSVVDNIQGYLVGTVESSILNSGASDSTT